MICSSSMARLRPRHALKIRDSINAAFYVGPRMNGPWANRERIEALVHRCRVAFEPSLGSILLDILAPYRRVAVNRIARDAEDGALREELSANRQAAFRSGAGKPKSRGRVDPECLVDACIKVRKVLHLGAGGNGFVLDAEPLVQFAVQALLCVTVACQVIQDCACRAKWCSR